MTESDSTVDKNLSSIFFCFSSASFSIFFPSFFFVNQQILYACKSINIYIYTHKRRHKYKIVVNFIQLNFFPILNFIYLFFLKIP